MVSIDFLFYWKSFPKLNVIKFFYQLTVLKKPKVQKFPQKPSAVRPSVYTLPLLPVIIMADPWLCETF